MKIKTILYILFKKYNFILNNILGILLVNNKLLKKMGGGECPFTIIGY